MLVHVKLMTKLLLFSLPESVIIDFRLDTICHQGGAMQTEATVVVRMWKEIRRTICTEQISIE